MRWLILLALATGCVARERSKEKAREISAPGATCVTEHGKGGDTTFCIDTLRLTICTSNDGCITVPLGRDR